MRIILYFNYKIYSLFKNFFMAHLYKVIFTLLTLLIISACQSIDVRGQFVSEESIQTLNAKKLTKQEVSALIGTPTYIPDYSSDTWYYIQRSAARKAWLSLKIIDQRVVKVIFSGNKVVQAILIEDMDKDIAIQSTYTETHGTKRNGIQKFVKNIGRFNKTTDGHNRKKKK